jgi:hypothetical protein
MYTVNKLYVSEIDEFMYCLTINLFICYYNDFIIWSLMKYTIGTRYPMGTRWAWARVWILTYGMLTGG